MTPEGKRLLTRANMILDNFKAAEAEMAELKGMGISTFLKMVAAADDDLSAVSFSPPFFLDLDIAWKENRHLSRANQAFIDYLLAYRGGELNMTHHMGFDGDHPFTELHRLWGIDLILPNPLECRMPLPVPQ